MALRVSSVSSVSGPVSTSPRYMSVGHGGLGAFLVSLYILFTTVSSSSPLLPESSDSVSTNPGDLGAFLVSLCILFTTGSSSSLLLSESSDSISPNSRDFGAFLGLSLYSFYHRPLCHCLLFHVNYLRRFLCLIPHLPGSIVICE